MMESAVSIHNVTKSYNGKAVLSDISLSIPKGSIFGFLGPNGAGKTSLISIISCLLKQTSGEVLVLGESTLKKPNECKKKIGIAIQEVFLDPFFSVYDYLIFIAGYYGIASKLAKSKVLEVCNALNLTEHLNKKTRILSGGMKRRLTIAKALMHNPDIIILDEPTAGVDIELRISLWEYMLSLQKQGKTIILTTHYLEEAQSFCDNIAFIKNGKIILNDTKERILKKISTKMVSFKISNLDSVKRIITSELEKNTSINFNYKQDVLEVKYNPDIFEISNIIKLLEKLGVTIKDILSKETSLDDIFLSIFEKGHAN